MEESRRYDLSSLSAYVELLRCNMGADGHMRRSKPTIHRSLEFTGRRIHVMFAVPI